MIYFHDTINFVLELRLVYLPFVADCLATIGWHLVDLEKGHWCELSTCSWIVLDIWLTDEDFEPVAVKPPPFQVDPCADKICLHSGYSCLAWKVTYVGVDWTVDSEQKACHSDFCYSVIYVHNLYISTRGLSHLLLQQVNCLPSVFHTRSICESEIFIEPVCWI